MDPSLAQLETALASLASALSASFPTSFSTSLSTSVPSSAATSVPSAAAGFAGAAGGVGASEDESGRIGTDIVSVERIRRIRGRDGGRFDRLAFTPTEIAYCRSKHNSDIHFAGHLAAKEAAYKALRLAWEAAFSWTFIEVYHRSDGSPGVRQSQSALNRAPRGDAEPQSTGLSRLEGVSVSIAHTDEYAIAVAWAGHR